jgi:ribonucleotide reductase alpha subunit
MASKKLLETDVYPSDPFKVWNQALAVEVELAKLEHERIYGIDRVIGLVDAEFRRKFNAQRERIAEAVQARDEERLERASRGFVAAYRALTKWAEGVGLEKMPKIDCMEHWMNDGSLLVVVRDKKMAIWYEQFRKTTAQRSIWTLAELEVVMNNPTLSQVRGIKAALPGTTMVPVEATGSSGFEDMKNDIDISKPFRGTKLFDTDKAEIHAQGGKRGTATK